MQDGQSVPCLSQFSLILKEEKINRGVFVIFLIKSNVISVLLPEMCYKDLKSDLTVLITFCYLVALFQGFLFHH